MKNSKSMILATGCDTHARQASKEIDSPAHNATKTTRNTTMYTAVSRWVSHDRKPDEARQLKTTAQQLLVLS